MKGLELYVARNLDVPLHEELLRKCEDYLERMSTLGPSDNDVTLTIRETAGHYIAAIKMHSSVLRFELKAAAYSPIVAIERAAKNAMFRVNNWSVSRPE